MRANRNWLGRRCKGRSRWHRVPVTTVISSSVPGSPIASAARRCARSTGASAAAARARSVAPSRDSPASRSPSVASPSAQPSTPSVCITLRNWRATARASSAAGSAGGSLGPCWRSQAASRAFHTDEVPIRGSSSTSTCSVRGQSSPAILLAIQAPLGGSRNTSISQRQLGSRTAACSASSMAWISGGCIGPTITAVIWLRSISTNGMRRLSPSASRRSAW